MELSKKMEGMRAERPSEWMMDEYIRDSKGLENENEQLKARVAELEDYVRSCLPLSSAEDLLLKSPEQSLASIKAQTLRELAAIASGGVGDSDGEHGWVDYHLDEAWLTDEADRIEQEAKQ